MTKTQMVKQAACNPPMWAQAEVVKQILMEQCPEAHSITVEQPTFNAMGQYLIYQVWYKTPAMLFVAHRWSLQ